MIKAGDFATTDYHAPIKTKVIIVQTRRERNCQSGVMCKVTVLRGSKPMPSWYDSAWFTVKEKPGSLADFLSE